MVLTSFYVVLGGRAMESGRIEIEKLLSRGKTVQVNPIGYSMYPLLVPGRDAVRIVKADPALLRRGDVVLYRREGSILVIHRVWKRRGDEFYFVGDNQSEVEGPLPERQIRGKMIGFERKGRYVSAANPIYRLLSGIWLLLRPMRPAISRGVHALKRRGAREKRF